jgi:hypothetical protein
MEKFFKTTMLLGAVISALLGTLLSSDSHAIIGSVFLAAYSLMKYIDLKIKAQTKDEQSIKE